MPVHNVSWMSVRSYNMSDILICVMYICPMKSACKPCLYEIPGQAKQKQPETTTTITTKQKTKKKKKKKT